MFLSYVKTLGCSIEFKGVLSWSRWLRSDCREMKIGSPLSISRIIAALTIDCNLASGRQQ